MRIRAERDDLADVLSRAARAIGARSPLPILQGVLVEVTGQTMRVTGTDLEVTVRTDLEVEVMEDGVTVIPARLASEAVRKLPPGAVILQAGDGPAHRWRAHVELARSLGEATAVSDAHEHPHGVEPAVLQAAPRPRSVRRRWPA